MLLTLPYSTFFCESFSKIHSAIGLDRALGPGGNCYTGAAAISPDTYLYFESLGIPLQSVYGSTEASGPQSTELLGI